MAGQRGMAGGSCDFAVQAGCLNIRPGIECVICHHRARRAPFFSGSLDGSSPRPYFSRSQAFLPSARHGRSPRRRLDSPCFSIGGPGLS